MTIAGFTVVRADSGKWQVIDPHGGIKAECDTNAAAWRALDRLSFEPVNRSEDVHDWSARQNASAPRNRPDAGGAA